MWTDNQMEPREDPPFDPIELVIAALAIIIFGWTAMVIIL